jgi:hypothetical protein
MDPLLAIVAMAVLLFLGFTGLGGVGGTKRRPKLRFQLQLDPSKGGIRQCFI